MTNIAIPSNFSLSSLKLVTDRLNNRQVDIPTDIFYYDQFWAFPQINDNQTISISLSKIFNKLGILLIANMPQLLSPSYEKYIADLMGVQYFELVGHPPEKGLHTSFKVLKYNKLNHKLYQNDTIYVCNTGKIVVLYKKDVALKLRKIRGNE